MRLTQKLQTLLYSTEREAIQYQKCNVSIDDCIKNPTIDTVEQLQELRVGRMMSVGVLAELDAIAQNSLSAREYRYYKQRAAIFVSPLLLLNE